MHRAWKPAVAAALAGACALLVSSRAHAFHAGDVFDKPAGAGGGGGIFYTGVPGERRWTCAACHLDAPGSIRVDLAAQPSSLFDSFVYQPGATYALTATLAGEHAGLQSARANFNSIAVSVVDASGQPAGAISGYAADDFYASGEATIVSKGQRVGATKWTFTWRAPDASAGPVSIHVAAVDGNGAGVDDATSTLTDPWGDDVFVGSLAIDAPAPQGAQGSVLPLVATLLSARRKR